MRDWLLRFGLILLALSVTAANRPMPLALTTSSGQLIPFPIQPPSIDYPEYTKPGIQRDYLITLINSYDSLMQIVAVAVFEDSAKPSAPSGWLAYRDVPTEVPAHDSRDLTLELNKSGMVNAPIPILLYGRLVIRVQFAGDAFWQDATLPISFIVADTIVLPVWDTLTTFCGIPLTVGSSGNMGHYPLSGANLGFPQPSPECDTGLNNRGEAAKYLADASPVVVRKVGTNQYSASWSLYGDGPGSPNSFYPLAGFAQPGYFSIGNYPGSWIGYNSGTFCTSDSLVKVERTWWMPSGAAAADSCRFVIMRTRYFPFAIGIAVSNLAIGDFFDFDVPSDSGDYYNVGGNDPTRRMVYMRGYNSGDTVTDCYDNSRRYASARLLGMHFRHALLSYDPYGGYTAANDSFVYPASGLVPEQLWENMQATGYSNETRVSDLHSVLVYKNAASTGFTLPANDTLNIWTAIAVVRPTGGTAMQGLDSLRKEIEKAQFWWQGHLSPTLCCCCIGQTGNVNGSASETPDLSDLSYLIMYMTTNPPPALPRPAEANIDTQPYPCSPPDISDLSLLIAFLISAPPPTLPNCP